MAKSINSKTTQERFKNEKGKDKPKPFPKECLAKRYHDIYKKNIQMINSKALQL